MPFAPTVAGLEQRTLARKGAKWAITGYLPTSQCRSTGLVDEGR